jgi:LPXTG-motif cell wall-anchored protein
MQKLFPTNTAASGGVKTDAPKIYTLTVDPVTHATNPAPMPRLVGFNFSHFLPQNNPMLWAGIAVGAGLAVFWMKRKRAHA